MSTQHFCRYLKVRNGERSVQRRSQKTNATPDLKLRFRSEYRIGGKTQRLLPIVVQFHRNCERMYRYAASSKGEGFTVEEQKVFVRDFKEAFVEAIEDQISDTVYFEK